MGRGDTGSPQGILLSTRDCPHPGGRRLRVPGEEGGLKTRQTPTGCTRGGGGGRGGRGKLPTSSKSKKTIQKCQEAFCGGGGSGRHLRNHWRD